MQDGRATLLQRFRDDSQPGEAHCCIVSACVCMQAKTADAKNGSAELETLSKELAAAKERVQQMTKKVGQMEAKVGARQQPH